MVDGEISTVAEGFREALNPLRIYLFGSYARGTNNAKSIMIFTEKNRDKKRSPFV